MKNERDFSGKRAGRLGTEKNPASVSVKTKKRLKEVTSIFEKHGWEYTAEVEKGKPEDIADLEQLMNPVQPLVAEKKVGRNDPCPCGSGKKHKKCCGGT